MLKLPQNSASTGKKSPRATTASEKSRPVSPRAETAPSPEVKPLEPGVITRGHVELFAKTTDDKELHAKFAEYLRLTDWRTDARHSIELDLYFTGYKFALEIGFTADKVVSFLDLLKDLHSKVASTDIDEAQRSFSSNLLQQTIPRSPTDPPAVFTPEDAKRVTDYFIQTYFQHYRLYQFTWRNDQPVQVSEKSVLVQTAVQPPALATAITDDEWRAQLELKRQEQLARDAEAAAFQEVMAETLRAEGAGADGRPPIEPETIRQIAESAVASQVTAVKEAVRQKLEASEAAILDAAAKRLDRK